jgi:hypothetical protein
MQKVVDIKVNGELSKRKIDGKRKKKSQASSNHPPPKTRPASKEGKKAQLRELKQKIFVIVVFIIIVHRGRRLFFGRPH